MSVQNVINRRTVLSVTLGEILCSHSFILVILDIPIPLKHGQDQQNVLLAINLQASVTSAIQEKGNKIMLKKLFIITLVLSQILLVSSCGQRKQSENYNFKTTNDLLLNENNHPHGYNESDCFYCHNVANIHQENNLGTNLLDLAKSLVDKHGSSSCKLCHGTNGVE